MTKILRPDESKDHRNAGQPCLTSIRQAMVAVNDPCAPVPEDAKLNRRQDATRISRLHDVPKACLRLDHRAKTSELCRRDVHLCRPIRSKSPRMHSSVLVQRVAKRLVRRKIPILLNPETPETRRIVDGLPEIASWISRRS